MKDFVSRKARNKPLAAVEPPARRKRSSPRATRKVAATAHPVTPLQPPAETPVGGRYPHIVGFAVDPALLLTLGEVLTAAQTAGDYSHTSVPDLIRASLRNYFSTRRLTALATTGRKKRMTMGLDGELWSHYRGLPQRKRGEIVERAVRTFLQQGF